MVDSIEKSGASKTGWGRKAESKKEKKKKKTLKTEPKQATPNNRHTDDCLAICTRGSQMPAQVTGSRSFHRESKDPLTAEHTAVLTAPGDLDCSASPPLPK